MTSKMVPLDQSFAPSPVVSPYLVFESFCQEVGYDAAAAPKRFLKQQLGVARNLLADGYTLPDILNCTRWLLQQARRLVDLRTVASSIGLWVVSGRPTVAQPQLDRPLTPGQIIRGRL